MYTIQKKIIMVLRILGEIKNIPPRECWMLKEYLSHLPVLYIWSQWSRRMTPRPPSSGDSPLTVLRRSCSRQLDSIQCPVCYILLNITADFISSVADSWTVGCVLSATYSLSRTADFISSPADSQNVDSVLSATYLRNITP